MGINPDQTLLIPPTMEDVFNFQLSYVLKQLNRILQFSRDSFQMVAPPYSKRRKYLWKASFNAFLEFLKRQGQFF
jgi:hypothetical protein